MHAVKRAGKAAGDFMLARPKPDDDEMMLKLSQCSICHRLFSWKSIKHMMGMSVGFFLCWLGAWIGRHEVFHMGGVPSEAVGAAVHGFGCVPLFKHVEPLWKIVTD